MSNFGAGLLIQRAQDGKVLLVYRADWLPHPNEWAAPGGSAEPDETPIQTAVREATEELGGIPLLLVRTDPFWQDVDGGFPFATFLALRKGKNLWEPQLNEENEAFGWFSPRKLPKDTMPATRSAMAELLR